MLTTIRYILLTSVRDWLFLGILLAIFAAFGISAFLGGTALVEDNQMSIVYAGASARVILLIGLIVAVCFHVRTAFQNREIDLILSRPISRASFVLAYWLGFCVVAALLVVAIAVTLSFMSGIDKSGLVYWSISLFMESIFLVAFSLFASLILRSAVSSVLLCFGFYFVSRMMGFFLFIIDTPHAFANFNMNAVTSGIVWVVSVVLPRLDLFSKSSWLIYGSSVDEHQYFFLSQTLVYVPFLLLLAIYDFKRKQF